MYQRQINQQQERVRNIDPLNYQIKSVAELGTCLSCRWDTMYCKVVPFKGCCSCMYENSVPEQSASLIPSTEIELSQHLWTMTVRYKLTMRHVRFEPRDGCEPQDAGRNWCPSAGCQRCFGHC